ncbi:MAG: hypothetical protein PUE68_00950, partial [Kiritimatiellae bacterium]|nr:hypothetical protein [Kiritimatiellia bacterium]
MDAATIQEVFGRAVMAGCLAVSVALVAAGLALVAKRAVRWSARTVRKVGVATFLAIGILAAWATYTGTPTLQDKSDAASRLEGESETNRLMGAAMGVGTLLAGGPSTLGLVSSDADDGAGPATASGDGIPDGTEDPSSGSGAASCPVTEAECAAGFVLVRVGTGEAWDFAPPPGAAVSDDWTSFGAARDWMYLGPDGWAFRHGAEESGLLRAFSYGRVGLAARDSGGAATNRWLAPFQTVLGLPPASRHDAAPDVAPSLFWHLLTPSNTLQLTWLNALVDREPARPVSFQAELAPSGRFLFRYDLSRLGGAAVSNFVAGGSLGAGAWTTNSLPADVTSLAFHPLASRDELFQDRDDDGLALWEELFVHRTDPDLPDTDCDGVPDGEEVARGTNPRTRDSDGDGLVDGSDPDPDVWTSPADLDGDGVP